MSRARYALSIFALCVVIALVPTVLGVFTVTLLNYIGIATLVTLGLVLLTGSGGMTSFGQAAFVGVGAYTTAYMSTQYGWPPIVGLAAALLLTFVLSAGIGAATLHLGGHYLPITTIAWGLAIYLLFGNSEALGRFGGIGHIPPLTVFGFPIVEMKHLYFVIWAWVLLALVAATNLLQSRKGRAIRALRGGSVFVESLGVNSFEIKLILFIISALLAALAGWLYAHMQRFVSPAMFDLSAGIQFLLMAVLGGSGTVSGALVGAAAVILTKNWLQDILPHISDNSGNLEAIVFGVIFILLLQYAPAGLVPAVRKYLSWPESRKKGAIDDVRAILVGRPLPAAGTPLLTVENLTKRFGGLLAVDDVSFDLAAGTILALIGPNGAGKTTTFNLVTGVSKPSSGRIVFGGLDITAASPRYVAAAGIARTFQHVKLRPAMSVLENVMLGAYMRTHSGFFAGCLCLDRRDETAVQRIALEALQAVGLVACADNPAGSLPLGQQRLLEIARALAADPVLIMLDEPAAGLRSGEKRDLSALLAGLRKTGVTILLVEHDMPFLMGLADQVVVLNFGKKIAAGRPAEIRSDANVQEAYLGSVA